MFKKIESIPELKKICQKHKRNKNFLLSFGYLFHRNLSIYITKFFLIFFPKLSPNIVSLFMIVISLFGCGFLLFTNLYFNFLGLILIYFSFLLDKVDGEMARYKKEYSVQGIYLDELYHFLVPTFVLFSFFLKILNYKYATFFLLVAMVFSILNRVNRKLFYNIYFKQIKIQDHSKKTVQSNFINKIFNTIFFKSFSLVERFDLFIFSLFILFVFEIKGIFIIDYYFLIVYSFFCFIYFIRWMFLNYYGNIEKEFEYLDNILKK